MDYDRLDYWTDCLLAVLEKEEGATTGGEGEGSSAHDKQLRDQYVQFRANAVVREASVLVLQHLICGKWIVHGYHTFQAQTVEVCTQETGLTVIASTASQAKMVQIPLESIEPGDIFTEGTAAEVEASHRRKSWSQPSPDGVADFPGEFPQPSSTDMATIKKQLTYERQGRSRKDDGTYLHDGGLSPALRRFLDSRRSDIPENSLVLNSANGSDNETLEMDCSLICVGLQGLIEQLNSTGVGGSSSGGSAAAPNRSLDDCELTQSPSNETKSSFLSGWTCPTFERTDTQSDGIESVRWNMNCAQSYLNGTNRSDTLDGDMLGASATDSGGGAMSGGQKRDCSEQALLVVQLLRRGISRVAPAHSRAAIAMHAPPRAALASIVGTICTMLGYSRSLSPEDQLQQEQSHARCTIHTVALQTQHDVSHQLLQLYLQRIARTCARKSAHLRQLRHSWNHWVVTTGTVGMGGGGSGGGKGGGGQLLINGGSAVVSAIAAAGGEFASGVGQQLNSWVATESAPAVPLSPIDLGGEDQRHQAVAALVDVCTFAGTGTFLNVVFGSRNSAAKLVCQCLSTVYISARVKHDAADQLEQLHPFVDVLEANIRLGASIGLAALAELQQGVVETLFS
jgi:hypothetical protein